MIWRIAYTSIVGSSTIRKALKAFRDGKIWRQLKECEASTEKGRNQHDGRAVGSISERAGSFAVC